MDNNSESSKDLGGFFAVHPRDDCPHIASILENPGERRISNPCQECGDLKENWICIQCGNIYCSRYVNGHMLEHNQNSSHPIALSFTDLSFWCFACDSYIVSNELRPLLLSFQNQKFPMLINK
ncbi:hypothetical protein SteCoe_28457 [Stentor coeruleus]|uniref:UBP-type domain-containing protein n=1 Tax=Stentor coeruleus TaxID=5963 RepID=A0A1R2B851_9CILI|nr:hypothetical protein SteCoe_28457 [Stentor coeruleus]